MISLLLTLIHLTAAMRQLHTPFTRELSVINNSNFVICSSSHSMDKLIRAPGNTVMYGVCRTLSCSISLNVTFLHIEWELNRLMDSNLSEFLDLNWIRIRLEFDWNSRFTISDYVDHTDLNTFGPKLTIIDHAISQVFKFINPLTIVTWNSNCGWHFDTLVTKA